MSSTSPIPYYYQTGGSLAATAPSYVVRKADTELWKALQVGEYCYVLNARQMGKSSLRARIMRQLKTEGIASAEIELNGIGSQHITAQQWYGGIIWELISGFSLSINRSQWLREHISLSPVQRLRTFIETILLDQISGKIIVFFDEIDSVLGLEFPTDEFFALIRYFYERRASNSDMSRLSFVLLGVATPSELIQNKPQSTPFNIGRFIELQSFKIHEIHPLCQGLAHLVSDPELLLQEVLTWTGGQPFLTQKLCWLLQHKLESELQPKPRDYAAFVENLVKAKIIQDWEAQDEPEHLRTIRDRILLQDCQTKKRILRLYQKIFQQRSVKCSQNPDNLTLKFSGLVESKSGYWVVKNKIYQTIFDLNWLQQALPDEPLLPQWKSVAITSGLSLVSAGLVIAMRLTGLLQPWELQAFDTLMQLRPVEGQDARLLIITVTETDVQNQPIEQRGAASLSDAVLDQLRLKLVAGQPRVIGLDIHREQSVVPQFLALQNWMQSQDNFVTICSYGEPGVPPPPNIPFENYGFNNVLEDSDGVLRRYPIAVGQPSPCQNSYAFSWLLATRYLAKEGVEPQITPEGFLKLGSIVFHPLESNSGAYHNINASGHQVLINPRVTDEIAETIPLGVFLSDQIAPEIVRDRIVMVGTSAPSFNDYRWLTSQSRRFPQQFSLTGTEVQANLVSQILSAVLEERPLIWYWPTSIELAWVLLWAIIGGTLAQSHRSRQNWLLFTGMSVCFLAGTCWVVILGGGWIPLLPAGLSLIITSGGTRLLLKGSVARINSVTSKF